MRWANTTAVEEAVRQVQSPKVEVEEPPNRWDPHGSEAMMDWAAGPLARALGQEANPLSLVPLPLGH